MGFEDYFNKVDETAKWIKKRISIKPGVVICLSGGLDDFVNGLSDCVTLNAGDIPNFPAGNVEGHKGRVHFGRYENKDIVVLQGRAHYYEGHTPQSVVFPHFVFSSLGARTFVSTNAVGGIRRDLRPGDVLLVNDHINMMGTNPLIGISTQRDTDQFTSMIDAYDPELGELAKKVASSLGIELKEGVYLGVSGPSYETAAEIKGFRSLGADAVGMSVVFETIAARFLGLHVLCFVCIANMAADLHEGEMTHSKVLASIRAMAPKVVRLLQGMVGVL